MGKKEDERIARLAKKNADKPTPPAKDKAIKYDDTLKKTRDGEDGESKRLFNEMKKREF